MVERHPCPHRFPLPDPGGPSRAVFLDRDGVLIRDTGYPDDPNEIEILPGVPEALQLLRQAGWRLVVVSNQSGIARGKFGLARLEEIHRRLAELLAREDAAFDALYFCPHHPDGPDPAFTADCDHRKPLPGMLLTAAQDLGLDLGASWMVGDKESDVEAAHAAGCRAILLGEGSTAADASAPDLLQAARVIIASAAQ